jgi:hypothetical protein
MDTSLESQRSSRARSTGRCAKNSSMGLLDARCGCLTHKHGGPKPTAEGKDWKREELSTPSSKVLQAPSLA